MKKLRLKFYPGLAKSKEGKKEKAQQRGKASKESRSAAVEVSLNGDTGDDETSSLFGEASKFHKPGEYTVDQDTGHITWFVISFNLICFQPGYSGMYLIIHLHICLSCLIISHQTKIFQFL